MFLILFFMNFFSLFSYSFPLLSGHLSHIHRPLCTLQDGFWLQEMQCCSSKAVRLFLTLSWCPARALWGVSCGICPRGRCMRTPCSAPGVFKEQRARGLAGVELQVKEIPRQIKESFSPFTGPAFIKPPPNDSASLPAVILMLKVH